MICAPDTDVTENSHSGCSGIVGHQHKKTGGVYVTLSFNFVKVRCAAMFYIPNS